MRVLLRGACAALLASMLSHAANAATLEVGAGLPVRSPAAVPWTELHPGDEVVLHAGTYRDPIVIAAHGTAEHPIVLRGEGRPVIENSVVLEGASHVEIEGVAVRNARFPGFIIRHGASFDTIRDSSVADSGLGIWIGDGAGGGHRILGNEVHDTKTHGIAVDRVNAPEGQETVISGNRVWRNAMHGIEVNGNRYVVEHNLVWDNGLGLSGTSGIHIFTKDDREGSGRFNVIRYNIVSGQNETGGQDGVGIEIDQWCDNNLVYFNVAFANDGAGIVLFDAANNVVANNTLFGNMLNSGGKHAYKAELVIASDFTKKTDHSFGNIVLNNLLYSTHPGVYAIYVDPFSAHTTKQIGNNLLYAADQGGELYFWGGKSGRDLAAWNALKPGPADQSADPGLLAPPRAGKDLAGWAGLALPAGSPLAVSGIATPVSGAAVRDLGGRAIERMPIGAFAGPVVACDRNPCSGREKNEKVH